MPAAAGVNSLGSLIWAKTKDGSDVELRIGAIENESKPEIDLKANSERAENAPLRSLASMGEALPLASAEQNIFQLVSQRYRSTDLFRQAGMP